MPLYATPKSGPFVESFRNFRSIQPGQRYAMFDGSETPALELASIAFVRGPSVGGGQAYTTFYAAQMPSDCEIEIQGTNTAPADVEEADWVTLATLTSEAASPAGFPAYTDSGSCSCFRAVMTAYSSGDMPTLIAQR